MDCKYNMYNIFDKETISDGYGVKIASIGGEFLISRDFGQF